MDALRAAISIPAHHPRGPLACRPALLVAVARQTTAVSGETPLRGRWTLPASLRPSLTLRASRPPSIGSSSLFCLVCFCLFVIVILCFIVPCGCWLRCFRRMALRLRIRNCIGFVPRLGVWMRVELVPRPSAWVRSEIVPRMGA